MSACIFCDVVAGKAPSQPVAESEHAYAFRDLAPQAPVHVLVVPKQHVVSAHEVPPEQANLLSEVVLLAQEVARVEGIDGPDRGYRLVLNVGPDANMTVGHLHLHVLGGRSMGWPPG